MKAEQRKELETNTLADKVGQAMQRSQGQFAAVCSSTSSSAPPW